MANQGNPTLYRAALDAILAWAAQKRAGGYDPFALNSGNGNQGLDALLAQRGISLADFNQAAMDLGITFTTGTTWLRAYVAALQSALGVPNTTTPGSGYTPQSSGLNMNDLLFYGGLGLVGLILLRSMGKR